MNIRECLNYWSHVSSKTKEKLVCKGTYRFFFRKANIFINIKLTRTENIKDVYLSSMGLNISSETNILDGTVVQIPDIPTYMMPFASFFIQVVPRDRSESYSYTIEYDNIHLFSYCLRSFVPLHIHGNFVTSSSGIPREITNKLAYEQKVKDIAYPRLERVRNFKEYKKTTMDSSLILPLIQKFSEYKGSLFEKHLVRSILQYFDLELEKHESMWKFLANELVDFKTFPIERLEDIEDRFLF